MDNLLKTENVDLRSFYKIGAYAALLQLGSILVLLLVGVFVGSKPATAEEYFAIHESSRFAAIMRGDFLLLFLIGAYLGTFPALYLALRPINHVAVFFATLFTFIVVINIFATESTFALLYLGNQYAMAVGEAEKIRIITAAEAIIAADMWHSTAAYTGGIFCQGSGVVISIVMLRSKDFSKITAIAGLTGNALDLIQHIVHPFMVDFSAFIHPIMGIFYVVWFPMLAWDFFRLAKKY